VAIYYNRRATVDSGLFSALPPVTRHKNEETDRRKNRIDGTRSANRRAINKNNDKTLPQDPDTVSGNYEANDNRTRKRKKMHYIKTTTSPEACQPRRLAPDKLKAAKVEFSQLMKEDIIRPSKSL